MSNIGDLKTALIAAAASITNEIDRLDCLSAIDDWYACRSAVTAFQTSNIASYSIAGRTVTRTGLQSLEVSERQLWARIMGHLYSRGWAAVDVRVGDS